ncbi:MAG: HlyD family secretion protein [Pseudomonadales bacterium]|nr:HlyD family secretion protein [Pseudomonadales bacterium]NRA15275.1 HlyD family efflux transporter periplasmic adaptor subunit [Oceanospirillaceae bacterium]
MSAQKKLHSVEEIDQDIEHRLAINDSQALPIHDVEEKESRPFPMGLLLFVGLAFFIAWASVFEIEQSVRVTGQVVPSAHVQIVQSVDGGTLAQLLVKEGDRVIAGQLLVVLEQHHTHAIYQEARSKTAAITAALIRAKAESENTAPVFGAEFLDYTQYTGLQQRLYQQRRLGLADEISTFEFSLTLAEEELSINEKLFAGGDISHLDVMRSRRQVNEIQGEISKVNNRYRQQVREEVVKLAAELQESQIRLQDQHETEEHSDITAPVAGVINYLKFNTIGGILRPGEEIMKITPTETELVIDTKIEPVDIGQVRVNMPVAIKLDSFDSSIFGSITGDLSYISSDIFQEQNTEDTAHTYYQAQVKVDPDYRSANAKFRDIALKPGMTATIDIRTNTRTVLQYLMKPVYKAFSGALSEK